MRLHVILILLASFFLSAASACAEEDVFQYKTVTTKEGLTFRVPEDMPIEIRGGIQTPIPFDEYMYGKFKKLEVRVVEMEKRLERAEKALLEVTQRRSATKVLSAQ